MIPFTKIVIVAEVVCLYSVVHAPMISQFSMTVGTYKCVLLQPKTELPDYSSDGESRTDAGSFLDNSAEVHGFGTMNGALRY